MMAVRRLQFELQKCSTPTQLESKPKCILCEHPKQKQQHFKDHDDLSFTREPRWPDDRRKMSRSMLHI
jgi:hypothetical protein